MSTPSSSEALDAPVIPTFEGWLETEANRVEVEGELVLAPTFEGWLEVG